MENLQLLGLGYHPSAFPLQSILTPQLGAVVDSGVSEPAVGLKQFWSQSSPTGL